MSFIKKTIRKIWASPEERIANLTISHAELCLKTMEAFANAIRGICEEDKEVIEDYLKQVYSYEEEADGIRRKIVEELAKGALPPLSREDFIRLAERMDLIADWAKEAARLLSVISCDKLKIGLGEECLELAYLMKEATEKLYNAVLAMMTDFNKSIGLVHEIEILEEKGDELYIKCLSSLERMDTSCVGMPGMLIEKLIETFENTLDACEETGDVIKIIVVRALR